MSKPKYKTYLDMDLKQVQKMSKEELRSAVIVMKKTTTRRLHQFEKENLTSPATEALKKSGGMRPTGQMTRNQLMKEFTKGKKFLSSKTASVAGLKKSRKAAQEKVQNKIKEHGIDFDLTKVSKRTQNKFWHVFDRLKEKYPDFDNSDKLLSMVTDYFGSINKRWGEDRILSNLDNLVSEMYEAEQRELTAEDGLSGFFL